MGESPDTRVRFLYFYVSAGSSDQAGSKITKLAYLDPLGEGFVNASELSASPTHLLCEIWPGL